MHFCSARSVLSCTQFVVFRTFVGLMQGALSPLITDAQRCLKAHHLTGTSAQKTKVTSSFPARGALSTLSISVYCYHIYYSRIKITLTLELNDWASGQN